MPQIPPPPPYANVTGITRSDMKFNEQETIANYDGNARPGELVVDLTSTPPLLYVGDTNGNLNPIGGAGGDAGGPAFSLQFNDGTGNLDGLATLTLNPGTLNAGVDIIPQANNLQSLGNATNQWKDLWVSNSTIYLNGIPLSTNSADQLTFDGAPLVLSSNTAPPQTGNISTTASVSGDNIVVNGGSAGGVVFADGTTQTTAGTNYGDSNVTSLLSGGTLTTDIDTSGIVTGSNVVATGNVLSGNLLSSGGVYASGNIGSLGIISAVGNVTGGNVVGIGAVTGATVNAGASNISLSANTLATANSVMIIDPSDDGSPLTGNVNILGNLTVTGNVTYTDFSVAQTANLLWIAASSANTPLAATGGGLAVGNANAPYATWTFDSSANVWRSSIGVTAIGDITAPHFIGDASLLTNIPSANVVGTVANANVATYAGTVTTNAQPNITSVGTLSSLAVTGNVDAANFNGPVTGNVTGNVTGTHFGNVVGNVSGTLTGNVVASNVAANNVTANNFIGNGSQLTSLPTQTKIANGTSNVQIATSNGNVTAIVNGVLAATITPSGIALGNNTSISPAANSVAVGSSAGLTNQLAGAVAVGASAGGTGQGSNAIAIGSAAGTFGQTSGAIAIGAGAGPSTQGGNAVAIGTQAGGTGQGRNSIAIGAGATATANSIMLNATGSTKNAGAAGFYVAPTRNDVNNTSNVAFYNAATAEVTYANSISVTGNITTTANISGSYILGNGALLTGIQATGGTQGTTGAQGPTGTQGTDGSTGAQGTQGATGSTGTQGTTGNDGVQGAIGTTGTQGTTGSTGVQGAIGAGTQGTTGAQGTQGVQGDLGVQGSTGAGVVIVGSVPTTAPDPQAALNAAFPSAVQGDGVIDEGTGDLWILESGTWLDVGQIVGPQGPTGPQGTTGAGTQGTTGAQGTEGTQGTTGTQGIQGTGSNYGDSNVSAYLASGTNTANIITTGNVNASFINATSMNNGTTRVVTLSSGNVAFVVGGGVAGVISPTSVALGLSAGTSQANNSVAIGASAGFNAQSTGAVAIGASAGANTQGASSIAIGSGAGVTTQASQAIAIGLNTGGNSQALQAIAIGSVAGNNTQGSQAVAIGTNAGQTTQGQQAVAIGLQAGQTSQSSLAVAIGRVAGQTTQGSQAVALGFFAGSNAQGASSIAIGSGAGNSSQGAGAVAIGYQAGNNIQGTGAIAIGALAGNSSQAANSIQINATGASIAQATANTFIVAPVRNDTSNTAQVLNYNTTTNEVTYANAINLAGTITSNGGPTTTSFVSGAGAASNVALYLTPNVGGVANQAIRDYSTGNSIIYIDVGMGGANTGHSVQIRGSNAFTNYATISATGIATPGAVVATGNVTGGNILSNGVITTSGTATFGNVITAGTLTGNGSVAFIAGAGADNNVAMLLNGVNMAFRDNASTTTSMYFDVINKGAAADGTFQFRAGNTFTGLASLSTAGLHVQSGAIQGTGTLITTPGASVYGGAATSCASGTSTLLTLDTEQWDTSGFFNNTNGTVTLNGLSAPAYSFCPNVPGYYLIEGCVSFASLSANAGSIIFSVYKNNAEYKRGARTPCNTAGVGVTVSVIVPLNGTGDYVQLRASQSSGTTSSTEAGATFGPYLQAQFLRGL